MLGADPNLYECLASSFTQLTSFPFEIILSVADPQDPALAIANQVIAAFPEIDARVVVGDVSVGVNPKINNLVKSEKLAKYPILWILDANTWTSSTTLQHSLSYFTNPHVNLVHHIPIVHASLSHSGWDGLGGLLDDMYMATMHAKMYALINTLSPAPCVMGKSNLLRKSTLPKPTGLAEFSRYIAEDHLIAVHCWRGRGSHVLGLDCVRQPLSNVSWREYARRRIRWVRVRKYMTTAATLVEPFTECFVLGLIGAFSVSGLIGSSRCWKLWSGHVVAWLIMDRINYSALRSKPFDEHPPFSPPSSASSSMGVMQWIGVWLMREGSALPLWIIAMSSDKIGWRGSWFVIHRDMTAHRVER